MAQIEDRAIHPQMNMLPSPAPGGEYSDWNADGIDDLVYAYARDIATCNQTIMEIL